MLSTTLIHGCLSPFLDDVSGKVHLYVNLPTTSSCGTGFCSLFRSGWKVLSFPAASVSTKPFLDTFRVRHVGFFLRVNVSLSRVRQGGFPRRIQTGNQTLEATHLSLTDISAYTSEMQKNDSCSGSDISDSSSVVDRSDSFSELARST